MQRKTGSNRQYKVLWIATNINRIGGVERVICGLSSYFADKWGWDVSIISLFTNEDDVQFPLSDRVKRIHRGLNIAQNPEKPFRNEFRDILTSSDTDIIITCDKGLGWQAAIQKNQLRGVKLIVTQHMTNGFFTLKSKIANALLYRRADKLVVLTSQDMQEYRKWGVRNVQVIPNAVFSMLEAPMKSEEKQVLAVGRIEDAKGFDLLLRSFQLVNRRFPDWKLCILGDGSKREELQKLTEDLGLQHVVEWPGFQKDVMRYMQHSAIYALSSRYEGFPIVLLEAMSYGLPIVAYDIPSVKEVFPREEMGAELVDGGDIDTFAQKLMSLMASTEKRQTLGECAWKRAHDFSLDNVAEKWKELFNDLFA